MSYSEQMIAMLEAAFRREVPKLSDEELNEQIARLEGELAHNRLEVECSMLLRKRQPSTYKMNGVHDQV